MLLVLMLSMMIQGPGAAAPASPPPDVVQIAQESRPAGDFWRRSTSRSVRLHNYNNWTFAGRNRQSRSELLALLARRDHVSFTERWTSVTPADLRALNPDIKVYRHYALSAKSEQDKDRPASRASAVAPDGSGPMVTPIPHSVINANNWWLRDDRGRRISPGGDAYYLDVGKPGFKEAFLRNALARMSGKGFDGVVLDHWHPKIVTETGRVCCSTYASDEDWFRQAWQPFVQYVTDGFRAAGYRVIGNSVGEYGVASTYYGWQRGRVDGAVYEQGAVDWRSKNGAWLPGSTIARRIGALRNDPLELWFANNGIRPGTPEYRDKIVVSLAMYYIGIPPDQAGRAYDYAGDWTVFHDPLWDFYIGTPAGETSRRAGRYFWARRYTRGLVLLNYDTASASYKLNDTYVDPNGRTRSGSITLGPHSALILKTR